ncbi:gamma-glutamylcyclotransferase family protein [Haloarchaeobius amylolyticus]|uniref:gamma-glutamylcyclotransferase family protein n=1 Tax=Haloarchaeobius amylolyticus TaxID=1198296 RepID=UPI00226F7FC8|nr:gamma-glutamylcyclotransferase family protein [Haloarchaeobius amylolyticus]
MDCFVYGTLTDPDRVAEVLDDWTFGPDAVLRGVHRVAGEYPTLAPGGRTTGRILRTDAVDTLDRYEGVDRGLYVRVPVAWDDEAAAAADTGADAVQVYVGDPAELEVDAPVAWPGTGSFEERVGRYVAQECTVSLRDD